MTTKQMQLKEQLDSLCNEYKSVWNQADNEKKTIGRIQRTTTSRLIRLEKAIDAINDEWGTKR